MQKFTWSTQTKENWINKEVDNTDVMGLVVSASSRTIYLANKHHGIYEHVWVDREAGEIRARWPLPDSGRKWNACRGIAAGPRCVASK